MAPLLANIERGLLWTTRDDQSLVDRILRIGNALLSLKEVEHFGSPQIGTLEERQRRLIDSLLGQIEDE